MRTRTHTPTPADTGIPGLTRRRVWHGPDVTSHPAVVVSPLAVVLAPPGELAAGVVPTLELGGDPADLLPNATAIPFAAVRRATHDLATNTLTLHHAGGDTAVAFGTAEAADAAFDAVGLRLGPGFRVVPTDDPWPAARGPLAAMVGIVVGTGGSAVALAFLENSALPYSLPHADRLDWRAVCGVGGAALALVQVRLYRLFTRPPAGLCLEPIPPSEGEP